ncbi:MAG: AAA family ATPase [Phenylobacterium sp.]|uniref:AAA family ATPase n=1 Tax=Phenylobacterium sp. TaxID=1871053 RepID=UPI002736EA96|nr:AAA family ATPase [Phenylobacterium sp.]MDP3172819.1 AAA family ATPase [Phenylobacterium sp.]
MLTDAYVATSIARRLIARIQATHERRRISVFSGPPGIGKTTAIDVACSRRPDEMVVVKIARQNAKEVLVLQHLLEGLRRLGGSSLKHAPTSLWELRQKIYSTMCHWAGVDADAVRQGEHEPGKLGRLTVIFDEAQNLSRESIDALRYWNDTDRCYAPFPLGLVFVGNSEFSLAGGRNSVISAAVADRALYVQTLAYNELTDEDLRLFISARVDAEPDAVAMIIRSFSGPRTVRSLRRVADLLEELADTADGRSINQGIVRGVLKIA